MRDYPAHFHPGTKIRANTHLRSWAHRPLTRFQSRMVESLPQVSPMRPDGCMDSPVTSPRWPLRDLRHSHPGSAAHTLRLPSEAALSRWVASEPGPEAADGAKKARAVTAPTAGLISPPRSAPVCHHQAGPASATFALLPHACMQVASPLEAPCGRCQA